MITYKSEYARRTDEGQIVSLFKMKGLVADTKPTGEYDEMVIANGSTFMEIDGDKFFMYDEEHEEWKDKTS